MRAALHSRQHIAAGMLQWHVHVFRQPRMFSKRIQQFLRDAIRIGVQETNPQQFVDVRQRGQQLRQPVAQPEILAVRRSVLADQSDFARARCSKIFCFAQNRFEAAAAEFTTQFRDDKETWVARPEARAIRRSPLAESVRLRQYLLPRPLPAPAPEFGRDNVPPGSPRRSVFLRRRNFCVPPSPEWRPRTLFALTR